jgi:hypothetical protein
MPMRAAKRLWSALFEVPITCLSVNPSWVMPAYATRCRWHRVMELVAY